MFCPCRFAFWFDEFNTKGLHMFKFTPLFAAMLAAVCSNAFAQSNAVDTADADQGFTVSATATPISTTSTLIKAAPTAAETTARSYQTWLNQVNKPYANQLGTGNGAGVVVGVADTGVQVSHPELKGQIVASYNAFTGSTDVTDQMGHGTHVSGIIAGTLANGALLEGVAPGAKIAMAKVFTTGGSDGVTIGRGIDWIVNVQKAPILSLSLGSPAVSMQTNIQNAVTKGTLITAALGNDGLASGSWPAKFAKETWAKGQIIAVGALDASNKRASFSNYDATLANWTVFAPGVNVASSYSVPTQQNAYVYMSGTSMATPVVAGQAALIKSNWNFLTAPDLAQIIFQSATHLCSDNVTVAVCKARTTADTMYGWGLVNVGASLQPIGSLNLTSKTGAVINFAGASLASAKSGMVSGLPAVKSLAVDKFNRAFVVNVGTTVAAAGSTGSAVPVTAATTTTVGAVKFSAEYSKAASMQSANGLYTSNGLGFGEDATATTLGKTSISFTNAQGNVYALGTGGTSAQFFGLQSTGMAPLSLNGEGSRFNAPYFALGENASHAGYATTLSNGDTLRFGSIVQSAPMETALFGASNTPSAMSIAAVEWQHNMDDITTVVTAGHLQETDAVLGMRGTGALGIAAQANTTFMTLAASKPVADNTYFSAMVSVGNTAAYSNSAASLIDGASASQSAAWSMGLARKDLFKNGDRLGFSVAMPLRTMSGNMHITTATAQSQEDGSLSYATQALALSPTGMEKDIELAYARPMPFGGTLSTMAQMKLEPGHDAQAATQYGIGFKYQRSF